MEGKANRTSTNVKCQTDTPAMGSIVWCTLPKLTLVGKMDEGSELGGKENVGLY